MKEEVPEIYSFVGKLTPKKVVALAEDLFEFYDWVDDHQFKADYLFLNNVTISYKKKQLHVEFDIEYRTKQHLVVNHQHWYRTINDNLDIKRFEKYILHTEKDIEIHNDLDDKGIVFGKRFNKQKFDEFQYPAKGWTIIK